MYSGPSEVAVREMGSKPMREFRIPLSIVDSDTLSRAQAIARYRWGHECSRLARGGDPDGGGAG